MALSMPQGVISPTCSSSPSPSNASSFKGQQLLSQRAAGPNCCSASGRALVVRGMGGLSRTLTSEDGHFGFSRRLCVGRGFMQPSRRWQQQAWEDPGTSSQRRGTTVVRRALPVDGYWITAFEAVGVAGLMFGIAVVSGILINIRIEVQAMEEYLELEKKGMLPEEMIIPDKDFQIDEPLYIFRTKDFSSLAQARNRPIREEVEEADQIKPEQELQPELETASRQE